MDEELQKKYEKALVYSTQPERFELTEIGLTMKSKHDIRHLHYANGRWNCTCEFFARRNTCSHVMAAELMFGPWMPKTD